MNVSTTPWLLHQLTVAQTRAGRAYLNVYARTIRCAWRLHLKSRPAMKRLFDIVVSSAFLVAFGPALLLIALLVKLEDGGSVFFPQTRVGRYGRLFKMYKFRSMAPDAEARLQEVLAHNRHAEGVTFKLKDDPRLTRVGKWLRRLSLDEFPQFYNVLLGDMSVVGPRPPVPREVALYSLTDRRRLAVKPGLTCLWQVNGRSEIDFSGQVELDVKYIETQSFWEDVKILAQTVPAVLTGRGAC